MVCKASAAIGALPCVLWPSRSHPTVTAQTITTGYHRLAGRSTPFVTLCLAAQAWLALAEGNPERAALLEGAAEGLRRRVGPPKWPLLRRVEADLVAQVRERLGAGQFDQAFSAGSALTQREAVAIVRKQRDSGPQTS